MEELKQKGHEASFLRAIVKGTVDSKLTPLMVLFALLLGFFSIIFTPSEEEPQIVVPMIDIFISMPGASPSEIETRAIYPMEKLLWELTGVEYIYSTIMPGQAMTVVRFKVGEDVERSLVKVYDKLYSHFDWIPPGCSPPLLKPRSIDDVPILVLTFFKEGLDPIILRRLVSNLDEEVRSIPGVSATEIKGGQRRHVLVHIDQAKLYNAGLDIQDVTMALRSQSTSLHVGEFTSHTGTISVKLEGFFDKVEDLRNAVLNVVNGRPVFLYQVADVMDQGEELNNYVLVGEKNDFLPGVSYAVSKRKGENATKIANKVIQKVESLRGVLLPTDIKVNISRNYGETARDKVDELLEHLAIATLSVAALMALLLGIRSSLVVLVAIPVTLTLTLFIYYIFGYTLNRVTLFALIFCIGILVDDPIVGVENIVRHLHLPSSKGRSLKEVITDAVVEVGSPLILATFTVIAAILPLAFVSGLMGPYMRPMPIGASVAMIFSMIISFVITPWAAYKLIGSPKAHETGKEDWFTRFYRWAMAHLLEKRTIRVAFLFGVVLFLGLSLLLIFTKVVRVKMLPFDNKSEFQVIIDMAEGTPLEETGRVAQQLAKRILEEEYVKNCEVFVGTSAPFNFNGLVRHYYLRKGTNVADIQVNLVPKSRRKEQSHDIAKRLRPELERIASKAGARIKVAEIPPGPPVLQTLVAEVYGPDYEKQIQLAERIKEIFKTTEGVVDVDWYMTAPQRELKVLLERDKAMLSGVTPQRLMEVLQTAISGSNAGLLHEPKEREDVPILVRLKRLERLSPEEVAQIRVRTAEGKLVPVGEIADIRDGTIEHPIYHKNLQRVVYVTGDVSGKEESPVYAILKVNKALKTLEIPDGSSLEILYTTQPKSMSHWSMKWDGEWHITYEVFRDMGFAFMVVLILIYIMVVGWFRSYSIPLVILSPIPLSLIGIIPAHALMGAFFTATSMIGFIAGAGIVVRNSIILVDFIELRLSQGMSLKDAVIDAGAIRFRPMLLTSSAVVVGSFVILFDPIFQGLAISLMAGEVAATLFSRMVVPILFFVDHRIKERKAKRDKGKEKGE